MRQVVQQSPWSVLNLSPILVKLVFFWCGELQSFHGGTAGSGGWRGLWGPPVWASALSRIMSNTKLPPVVSSTSVLNTSENRDSIIFLSASPNHLADFFYVQNLPSHCLWLSPLFCCLSVLRSVCLHCFRNTPSSSAAI